MFLTAAAYMRIYKQRPAAYSRRAVQSNSGQHWPTCIIILFKNKRQRKKKFLKASIVQFESSGVLEAADGKMKGEAPLHQHLGGICVNRVGSEALEGKVNNVRNRIWSLLTVPMLLLEVRRSESEAARWIIQNYASLGCLQLSSCQKVSKIMSHTRKCIQEWRFTSIVRYDHILIIGHSYYRKEKPHNGRFRDDMNP